MVQKREWFFFDPTRLKVGETAGQTNQIVLTLSFRPCGSKIKSIELRDPGRKFHHIYGPVSSNGASVIEALNQFLAASGFKPISKTVDFGIAPERIQMLVREANPELEVKLI